MWDSNYDFFSVSDFGASKTDAGNGSNKKSEDSWASWENDAWESLNKKD